MLDGTTPKTGKVWHKVHLEFHCQGLPTSADFLICPIGNNEVILGMPWLKDQNPSIDWREQTLCHEPSKAQTGYVTQRNYLGAGLLGTNGIMVNYST
jgi:hypothetical protein